nr:hypothetical protein C15B12.4 - Caenorhabditis elegans [Caenorhabditis elegans]
MRHLPLLILCYICFVENSLVSRIKRQTCKLIRYYLSEPKELFSAVDSNAETDGNGDSVLTDASTQHFKSPDGVLGMNVTANGNSSGTGSANIQTSAGGNVGESNVNNVANVMSVGDSVNSYSDIFAAVEGEKMTSNVLQQGRVAGQGATLSNVNGGSSMQNSNGALKNGFSYGNAGGTGSINTEAEVQTQQALSWDQLMARLMASASASGLGSAQSNLDLGTGSDDQNITISGLVSGLNSNEGLVNTLVKGNGIINGTDQKMTGTMYGVASGKGNSTLVGASSIVSNQSSSAGEIQAFGNSNAFSDGNSSVNLMSNTNIESDSGLGVVHIDGAGQGTDNYVVASNGLKFVNSENDAAFVGSGNIRGSGSDTNSLASQSVETAVDPSGFSNGVGGASGNENNVTGSGFVELDGDIMNGNSSMQAFGSGNGPIAADTKAVLNLMENGVQKNRTIHGMAAADGDNTHVQSLSMIGNINGNLTDFFLKLTQKIQDLKV